MIERIFLDLDDVCNSFTMASLEAVGCPVGPYDHHLYPVDCGFDITAAANTILGATDNRPQGWFWKQLSTAHWASIPTSKELHWLLELCEDVVGRKNICILTATPPCTDSGGVASAKIEWIRGFLPKWLHDQFLIGPTKHFCAGSSSLLIDDSDRNVSQWTLHGGLAILMPRPWNCWRHSMSQMECRAYFMDLLTSARHELPHRYDMKVDT